MRQERCVRLHVTRAHRPKARSLSHSGPSPERITTEPFCKCLLSESGKEVGDEDLPRHHHRAEERARHDDSKTESAAGKPLGAGLLIHRFRIGAARAMCQTREPRHA
jgi:hypothetical protein